MGDVGGGDAPGGKPDGDGVAGNAADMLFLKAIRGGGAKFIQVGLPCEQIDLQQINGGKTALCLAAQDEGGIECFQRRFGKNPGFEKPFQLPIPSANMIYNIPSSVLK